MPGVEHLELRELLDVRLDDARERAQRVGPRDGRERGPRPLRDDGARDRLVDLARRVARDDLADRRARWPG